MNAPLSFSSNADSKSWLKKKALPAIKKALPVIQKVANIAAVVFPGSAVIGKVAGVANLL
jgi:hypothetical protein